VETQPKEREIEHYVAQFDMERFLNDHLLSRLQRYRFPAYTHIFREEDEQHHLYFLVEGQLQCSHYHLNGKLAVFAVSNPFAAIGDMEILTDEPIRSNVIATAPTTLLGITAEEVEYYGGQDPRFLRFLIDQLRAKLLKTNAIQMSQVLPVVSRLALYLLAESSRDQSDRLFLPDKESLSSLLGTSTRHLNRVLNHLVHAGAMTIGYPEVTIRARSVLEGFVTKDV